VHLIICCSGCSPRHRFVKAAIFDQTLIKHLRLHLNHGTLPPFPPYSLTRFALQGTPPWVISLKPVSSACQPAPAVEAWYHDSNIQLARHEGMVERFQLCLLVITTW
jgi:hypothetical protein